MGLSTEHIPAAASATRSPQPEDVFLSWLLAQPIPADIEISRVAEAA
ncbi:hypothetical protein [Mesorhizobium sp. DCY119]|nr:hypothetical protein [Mesorhizobium sp. DCY119]